ncbi:unnamed protein product (mitochondrion) [Plasmodiophora brassicae]|uniref:Uncharacterized protein n=1 Tax=Plasmodiophora brassicae TaxID=37360 RepID=A0A3P3YAA8_PLABS|nr:unnamed protein product [Plasmodiophora brassicae]
MSADTYHFAIVNVWIVSSHRPGWLADRVLVHRPLRSRGGALVNNVDLRRVTFEIVVPVVFTVAVIIPSAFTVAVTVHITFTHAVLQNEEGRIVSPADPFAPDARRRPIPSGPLARYLSPQDVRAQKTPQRMAVRAEMESLTSLHYRDDYLKALGGQKKAITMKIHQQLVDWLRLRDDLTDDAVNLYTYEYTRLMVKQELSKRRTHLGVLVQKEGSKSRLKRRRPPIIDDTGSKKFEFLASLWQELRNDDDGSAVWTDARLLKSTVSKIRRTIESIVNKAP